MFCNFRIWRICKGYIFKIVGSIIGLKISVLLAHLLLLAYFNPMLHFYRSWKLSKHFKIRFIFWRLSGYKNGILSKNGLKNKLIFEETQQWKTVFQKFSPKKFIGLCRSEILRITFGWVNNQLSFNFCQWKDFKQQKGFICLLSVCQWKFWNKKSLSWIPWNWTHYWGLD